MTAMIKNIVFINASPKTADNSVSQYLADFGENRVKEKNIVVSRLNVRKNILAGSTQTDYATIADADAIIFIFPLYIFCLPGILMQYLQDYYQYYIQHEEKVQNTKVYAVVNCGFPEPEINSQAVGVVQTFCAKIHASFRFAVLIGGGPMILEAKEAPFMKRINTESCAAFDLVKEDIQKSTYQSVDNISISVKFPKKLYYFMGGRGWISLARKNGLKKKDLYRKPYLK